MALFIFGIFLAIAVYFLTNLDSLVIIRVYSKNSKRHYLAIKTPETDGMDPSDWTYYHGEQIVEDSELTNKIHSSYVNEDWYGDYKFYVDDDDHYPSANEESKELITEKKVG